MTRILTVALDLNATTREIPGEDIAAELSALVIAETVTHVTLLARPSQRLRALARPMLADRLLAAHPHLDVHLVSEGRKG
jgi:K+-sensing histidine kinase KdpD